jgi:hypothetical protein
VTSRILVPALALAIATGAGCGKKGESARGAVGGATAAAIAAGLDATARERAPWRCAALDSPAAPGIAISIGTTSWRLDGRVAARAPAAKPGPIRIAFVADAEGATPETLGVLRALRDRMAKRGVDAIVTLGGLGGTADEVTKVLDVLADGAILVVAIPGDREPAAGHRAAIAGLAARGVVDGSQIRWLVIDKVGVATLPGQAFAARLAHGVEGCGHTDEDATAILAAAPADLAVRILASQRAPRHADGSDHGALGATAGDPGLAAAIEAAGAKGADVVVHASLDGTPASAGKLAPGAGPVAIATGIASASPRLDARGGRVTPAALLVTIEGNRVEWQPIAP